MQAVNEIRVGTHIQSPPTSADACADVNIDPPGGSPRISTNTAVNDEDTASVSYKDARSSSSHPSHSPVNQHSAAQSSISVAHGEEEFAQPNRELNKQSHNTQELAHKASKAGEIRIGSITYHEKKDIDLEKAPASSTDSEEGQWDLEQNLRGTKDEDLASGIKSKHIGGDMRSLDHCWHWRCEEHRQDIPSSFRQLFQCF